jgi:hypothetical protein
MSEVNWSPENVISTIQTQFRDYQPMRCTTKADRTLCYRAQKYFGNWENAMAAAGLSSRRKIWTKQRVIEQLQAAYPRKQERVWRDACLATAAKRYFKDRTNALRAAGFRVPRPKPQPRWTWQRVLAAILVRHQRGLPLNTAWRKEPSLYYGARNHFGSWTQALAVAGLGRQKRVWTKQTVVEAVRDRHRRGLTLRAVWKDDPALHNAAKKLCGGWLPALAEAGFEVRQQRTWNKQSIVQAIQDWHQRGFTRMWQEDKSLYYTASRHFGSWQSALEAAGLESRCLKRWSKQRVIKELRACWSPQPTERSRLEPALVGAMWRYFGGLRKALAAAGLDPHPTRLWSSQRVILVLQDRHVRGLPVQRPRDGGRSLAFAAKRYFGSWNDALVASGLASECREPEPVRRWTSAELIQELQSRQRRSLSLKYADNPRLVYSAKKLLGGWRQALLAAGQQPVRRTWSKQVVIEEILSRHRRQSTSSPPGPLRDENLGAAAARHFGSWHSALVAAGLASKASAPTSRQRWSAQRVIEDIQRRRRRCQSLSCSRPRNRKLAAAARRYFGTWRKALLAANVEPDRPKRRQQLSGKRTP